MRLQGMIPFQAFCGLVLVMLLGSCVHEWPEHAYPERKIVLNISHNLDWTYHEMTVTRSGGENALARYHLQVFRAGETVGPVVEKVVISNDLNREDFSTAINLVEGSYDIYAWSDYADTDKQESMFFKTSDFSGIIYSEPYNGNNHLRDAFRGKASVTIEPSLSDSYHKEVDLIMERPLARYEFRATDIMDFIDRETSRGLLPRTDISGVIAPGAGDMAQRLPELKRYRVKMIYSGYMPSKFNNILNRPVDSSTGISYDAQITVLSRDEARLGFDYVMVNGSESSIPVAMEIYDPDGQLIGRSNPVDVPTQRGRTTIVRGRFLTSSASGGVGINPDFNGDFNIEVK